MTFIERRQLWQDRLRQQGESGLSPAQWCDAHGIKRRQFQDWQRRLATASASPDQARWVAVTLQPDTPPSAKALVIRVGPATIEVTPGVSLEWLTDVVRALSVC
ncbi:hypothetical protein PPOP_0126 [Paenibacillus popilliae ATCC 14706]|uniref:Uncharacterized protein n=1 Tax=Paenibacillus popilliae ATCC 14706 TaxID=1212764 RepID=M9LXN8_PAEPP|nr:hypothetical protein PPOP_0126 [Paenibacillus popilliae ATCC 14706]